MRIARVFMLSIGCAVALFGAPAVLAQADATGGSQAYREQRFDDAARLLRPLGEAGDLEAQFLLGQISFFGLGSVERNDGEAARWYSRPAEAGHAEAMYRLGYLYASGQGVAANSEQAASWWLKAAAKGHRASVVALGDFYNEGLYRKPDELRARQWLHRAALLGETESMYKLALNLLRSEMIPNDHRRSYAWFYIAARSGHESAQSFLDKNKQNFSPREVRRGEIWGKDYLEKRVPPPAPENES